VITGFELIASSQGLVAGFARQGFLFGICNGTSGVVSIARCNGMPARITCKSVRAMPCPQLGFGQIIEAGFLVWAVRCSRPWARRVVFRLCHDRRHNVDAPQAAGGVPEYPVGLRWVEKRGAWALVRAIETRPSLCHGGGGGQSPMKWGEAGSAATMEVAVERV